MKTKTSSTDHSFQVDWTDAGKPCFIRFHDRERADRFADALRAEGQTAQICKLRR